MTEENDNELDDELRDLLNETADDEEDAVNIPPPASDVRTIKDRVTIQPSEIDEITNTTNEIEIVDKEKFKHQLSQVTEEVLDAARADRQEAQDVINLCRDKIDGAPNDPPRMYVDGLVKAVEVKSNINQTVVKMIEANVKALTAVKPSIGQQNNTLIHGASGLELERILADPIDVTDV